MIINPGYESQEARCASTVTREAERLFGDIRHGFEASFGRWISRDPFANAEMQLAPNLYEYVRNNPIIFLDPLGLYDYSASETQLQFLGPAFNGATAGPIQGLSQG